MRPSRDDLKTPSHPMTTDATVVELNAIRGIAHEVEFVWRRITCPAGPVGHCQRWQCKDFCLSALIEAA